MTLHEKKLARHKMT